MAKYMIKASYTASGAAGLLKEGGSARQEALSAAVGSVGGSLDTCLYAFGGNDLVLIVDAPDNVSAAALGIAIGAAGAVEWQTTVLLTPEEIDAAVAKSVTYRPPGA